jgi:hypothetical protein
VAGNAVNVARSLARYASVSLGPEWEVRWADGDDEGTFARPFARVAPSTGLTSTAIGAHHREARQTWTVLAYATLAISQESATIEAARVEALLIRALTQGIDPAGMSTYSRRVHPLRIPYFDYTDVPVGQPAGDDQRLGWLRVVEPPSIASYPDPGDDRAMVVSAEARLSWVESVQQPATGQPVVQIVGARPEV